MPPIRDRDPRPSPEPTPAAEWAQRLRRGDAAAVHVVRQRVGRILAYRGLGIPRHERDDLEQEVMTELWQAVNRSGFDFSGGFWGFVEVVTARRTIDWLRTRRDHRPLDDSLPDVANLPLRRMLDDERSTLATRILAAFDTPCRDLVRMRLFEDRSYREIAQATGHTEGALRVQMYRCIRSARRIMDRLRAEGWAADEELR